MYRTWLQLQELGGEPNRGTVGGSPKSNVTAAGQPTHDTFLGVGVERNERQLLNTVSGSGSGSSRASRGSGSGKPVGVCEVRSSTVRNRLTDACFVSLRSGEVRHSWQHRQWPICPFCDRNLQ
jgi:hypothetical protein